MIDRKFREQVATSCYDALQERGFTRFQKKAVDWPLHDGFHAWVGLNEGWEGDFFEINPFVGIHVVPVEKLWTSLSDVPYRRATATYAIHMGKIAPEELAFRFYVDANNVAEARRLAELYDTAGLRYAKSISTYEALLPLLNDRVDMLGAYPERVACCLYLLRRQQDAQTFVKQFADKEPEYFSAFARAFSKMCQS